MTENKENIARSGEFNIELGILFIIFCLLNIPFLSGDFFPMHDSGSVLGMFYFFYSALFFDAQLAQWTPFQGFGMPTALHQWTFLTPGCYFAGLAGKILGVENALQVFRWAVFLDNFLLFMGTYLLGGLLYSRRATVWLVTLGAVGIAFWHFQIFYNFRIYYLIPLVLYFLGRFQKEARPQFFWFAGVVALLACLGNPLHFIPLWLLIGLVFTVILFWQRWRLQLQSLLSTSPSNLASAGLFLILLLVLMFFAFQLNDNTIVAQEERIFAETESTLASFLVGGSNPEPLALLWRYITGWPIGQGIPRIPSAYPVGIYDNTYYVGILILGFFMWSIFNVRDRWVWAIGAVTGILFVLSLGGMFAIAIYHLFPPIKAFRYICLLSGVMNLCLIMGAGFGFEDFCRNVKLKHVALIIFILFVLAEGIGGRGINEWLRGSVTVRTAHVQMSQEAWVFFLSRLGVYAFIFSLIGLCVWKPSSKRRQPLVEALLVALLLSDLVSYRYMVFQEASERLLQVGNAKEYFEVRKWVYQPSRSSDLKVLGKEFSEKFKIATKSDAKDLWYNFAQVDAGIPKFPPLLFSSSVDLFLRAKTHSTLPEGDYKGGLPKEIEKDQAWKNVLGMGSSKLNYFTRVDWLKFDKAIANMYTIKELDQRLILIRDGDGQIPVSLNAPDYEITVENESYSAGRVVFNVTVPSGANGWLVYADSFDKGWKARVDGIPVKIENAYLAFKAVPLYGGTHVVRFTYFDSATTILSYVIALSSIMFIIFSFVWTGFLIMNNDIFKRPHNDGSA